MQKNRSRKLLLVSNKVYHYRIPVYEHLSGRLADLGYEFEVIANEVESHAADAVKFPLQIEPFGFSAYRKAIARIQPDMVMFFLHARDLIAWPMLAMLKIRGTLVIYWNHGINLQAPESRLKRAVFGLFHRFADAIVLYSHNEKKYVAQKYWHKLFVANNTIDFGSIPDVPESKEALRKAFNIPFKTVVLFVGRVTPAKRVDDLISAAAFLEAGVGIVIVGEGLTEEQERGIERSGNIRYLGGIYDAASINRVFKMADIFSIPGKVGLGVNQAFYWGLPIVTEDVRHSPEIVYVKDGVNGFIVKEHDVRMLAAKINLLSSSQDLYLQFSDAARAEILANANIDKMCDGFTDAVKFLDRGSTEIAGD